MNLGTRATWPCGAKPCMCKIFHFAFGSKRVPTQLDMLEIYCVFEFARIRLPKPARQTVILIVAGIDQGSRINNSDGHTCLKCAVATRRFFVHIDWNWKETRSSLSTA